MKTFTASSLVVLATQLLSIGANPVPIAEANNLVARTCDCTAYDNAITAGDQNAAANAISTCEATSTSFPLLTPYFALYMCTKTSKPSLLADIILSAIGSTPCPAAGAGNVVTTPEVNTTTPEKSYTVGSYTQQWGDYTPTLWYDSPQCYPCEGKQYYQAGCHCEDCGHLPQPCKPAP